MIPWLGNPTGTVFENSQRSLAHGIAANLPGVKSVDNMR